MTLLTANLLNMFCQYFIPLLGSYTKPENSSKQIWSIPQCKLINITFVAAKMCHDMCKNSVSLKAFFFMDNYHSQRNTCVLVFISFYAEIILMQLFIYFITIYYGHKTGHKQVRGTKMTWHNDHVIFEGDNVSIV